MLIFLRHPKRQKIESLTAKHRSDPFTCDQPGTTRSWTSSMFKDVPMSDMKEGKLWKFRREQLGVGEADFNNAANALLDGKCFDLSWVNCVVDGPFEQDDSFCLIVKAFGLWAINFCRVIYVQRDQNETEQMVSVGIGTLPVHAAVGEEKLSVTMDQKTGQVDFLIGSYSRPSSALARLFAIYLRKRQDVFAVDATERMRHAIRSASDA